MLEGQRLSCGLQVFMDHQAMNSSPGNSGPLHTALALLSDPQPHTRQEALQLLAAAAWHQPGSSSSKPPTDIDAIFSRLCAVVATDSVPRLRFQALQALAGFHHASTSAKLQALSKRAVRRSSAPAPCTAAAAPPLQQSQHKGQQPPAKKRKQQQQQQQQQPEQAEEGLLDAATGAFVHGTEDDLPRVRLAAVAAVVSLSSRDALFADAAGLLLSDLVGDQLLEVRLAALRALLTQAEAFQQRKQPQQQQEQGHQQEQGQQGQQADAAAAGSNAPTANVDIEEAEEGEQQDADDSKPGATGQQPGATGQQSDAAVLGQSAAGPQQQQQQQRPRRSKPRKSDLPSWGKDAMLSAAAALSDKEVEVRHLALQLLQQLPPANVPDLLTVVKAVVAAIQRYPCQETVTQAWAFVGWLGSARAEMITLAPGKLAPQLASLLLLHPAAAASDIGAAAVAVRGGGAAPAGTAATAAAAEAAAAGAAGVLGVSDAGGLSGLPLGAQVLVALLLLGVQQRRQGLPSLLRELGKAGLTDLPVLQPWLAALQTLQQQQQPVPEQPQEGGAEGKSC